MTLADLKLEKQRILNNLDNKIRLASMEYKMHNKSQLYLKLKNEITVLKSELKKINNEIVKMIIVQDSFTFGGQL